MCRHLFFISLVSICFCILLQFTFVHGASKSNERADASFLEQLLTENYIANIQRRWQLLDELSSKVDGEADVYTDLKGLYETLKDHPSLMERRLQVGEKRPPPLPEDTRSPSIPVKKRTSVFDIAIAQPVCPFKTEWRLIYEAKDMNNSAVEVRQPSNNNSNQYQWFFTVSCDVEALVNDQHSCPFCCRGIHSRRYASMCITRKSYVMALVRKQGEINYDWNYIQVDSSCNCAISPKT